MSKKIETFLEKTRQLIYQFEMRSSLGQNYLVDYNIPRNIVQKTNIIENTPILEVGAGLGTLTSHLLMTKEKVIAVERDKRCFSHLVELKKIANNRLTLIEGDIFDIQDDIFKKHEKVQIISNLPYNMGSRLLIDWISKKTYMANMTLMLQKEVVERILAPINTKLYSKLTVLSNTYFTSKKLMDVSPNSFIPKPKVTSSVISLNNKNVKIDFESLNYILTILFSQRRKQIRNTLRAISPEPANLLNQLNISPELRAENLSLTEIYKIQNLFLCEKAKLKVPSSI